MELLISPTGVLQWKKHKSFDGYTVISPCMSKTSYLIDMEGDIVHEWNCKTIPGLYAELLPNGNLLRAVRPPETTINFGGVAGGVEELDWDGSVVWAHHLRDDTHTQHHCFKRAPNGNTFILAWEFKSREECISKGRNPATLPINGFTHKGVNVRGICPDYIIEVDKAGKTVWEWHVWDHLGSGEDELDINYSLPAPVGYMAYADWTHCNTIDYDEKNDLVMLNSRNFSEFYFIDHKTGKIVYRWGNPTAYGKGRKPSFADDGDQTIFGAHCPSFLENGNILLFDNGWLRPELNRSRVLEMNPNTGSIVWEYISNNPNSFSSPFQGAAQRLPNGNTLVTSTHAGQIFEVTPQKEVVWIFVSPWSVNGKAKRLLIDAEDSMPQSELGGMQYNMVHRAYRYGPGYPGLKGKKLVKKGQCVNAPYWFKEWEEMSRQDRAEAEDFAESAPV